jgi:hypothetical protein
MDFAAIPGQIERLIVDVEYATGGWSPKGWQKRRAPGKWSRVEIVGHLVDSARNNTERVVRALIVDSLVWPGYQQEEQVAVQHYHESVAAQTLVLWAGLNRHLAFVAGQVPDEKRSMRCHIGESWKVSLEELLLDYVAHMEHHLRQIFEGERATIRYSGLTYPLY